MIKIAFHTLGCKLNFAESSDLLRRFVQRGFEAVDFHQVADVYVINTCTVTAIAEKKGRAFIRQAHKLNPKALVAVIGCFAQVNAKEIQDIEGVGIILGNDDKPRLIELVENYLKSSEKTPQNMVRDISKVKTFYSSISYSDRTRGFLKVQDGCDYFCSYCEIPYARGRSRSCTINQAVEDAKILAREKKKEVVLTGINIGDFGKNTGENFLDLIKALDQIPEIQRYRISSIEPNLLSREIVEFCANSQSFMPHFHIPLQSGSNLVLKTMRRRYLREDFAEKVYLIKSLMPQAFIACDVMAGFNSESEEEFESCYNFLKNLPLSFIHVFTYSDRPDTKADRLPDSVPMHLRRQRSEILQKLSFEKKREFYRQNQNFETSVLWEESNKDGKMYGFTDNYIRVQRDFNPQYLNEISPVKLSKLDPSEEFYIFEE